MKKVLILFALLAATIVASAQCTTKTFPSTGCPANTLTVVTCLDGIIPATITPTADGYTITFATDGIDWSFVQGSAYVVDLDPTHRSSTAPQYVAATAECGSTQGVLKPSYTCENNPKVYKLYPGAATYNLRLIVLISRTVNEATCTYTYHYRYHDFNVPNSQVITPVPPATETVQPGKGKKK